MYAIIEDSGTQIQVTPGQVLDLDPRELEEGSETLSLDRVLLLGGMDGDAGPTVGQPYVDGVRVTARVLDEIRGPKIDVFKYKRRKGSRRKIGHRQPYLRVRITGIEQ